MNRRKIIALALGILVIGVSSIVVIAQYNMRQSTSSASVSQQKPPVTSPTPVTPPKTTPPAVTPPKTTPPVATPAANQFTLAQVAMHASQSSCWSAINGGVYDLTNWIGQHPGGAQNILSICGKDGSAAFNDQHGGQRRPANELAGFKIGTLLP